MRDLRETQRAQDFEPHNLPLVVFGTFALWRLGEKIPALCSAPSRFGRSLVRFFGLGISFVCLGFSLGSWELFVLVRSRLGSCLFWFGVVLVWGLLFLESYFLGSVWVAVVVSPPPPPVGFLPAFFVPFPPPPPRVNQHMTVGRKQAVFFRSSGLWANFWGGE